MSLQTFKNFLIEKNKLKKKSIFKSPDKKMLDTPPSKPNYDERVYAEAVIAGKEKTRKRTKNKFKKKGNFGNNVAPLPSDASGGNKNLDTSTGGTPTFSVGNSFPMTTEK